MSSYKESNENPAAHVDLTDGEDDPNPIIDESGDTDVPNTATGGACSKKRKNSSDVHVHFVDVQNLFLLKKPYSIERKRSARFFLRFDKKPSETEPINLKPSRSIQIQSEHEHHFCDRFYKFDPLGSDRL
ncbi:hypothetical protein Hanom_Chr16g01438861 [Helianthus anomalus]